MATGLAQPHDFRENSQVPALFVVVVLEDVDGVLSQGLVKHRLLRAHLDLECDLGAQRQLFQDLRLDAPEDKGADELFQQQLGLAVVKAFDGDGETFVEAAQAAEQAGVDEVEEIPQLAEVIFDRGAGGDQLEAGGKRHRRLRPFGGGVFDRLCLVEDDRLPRYRREQFVFLLQQGVGGDQQVEFAEIADAFFPVATGEDLDLDGRGETSHLGLPVGGHRGRGDHQRRPVRRQLEDDRQRLQGLTKSHVIGQAAPHPPVGEASQPFETFPLVDPEFGAQGRGQLRHIILGFAHSFEHPAPALIALGLHLIGELFQLHGGKRMEEQFVVIAVAIGKAIDLLETFAELLGEGNELAVVDLDETARALAQLGEKLLEFNDLALVEGEFPA